jgi:hypothetical protein
VDFVEATSLSPTIVTASAEDDIRRKNNEKRDAEIAIPDNYSIHEPPPTADGMCCFKN